MTDLENFARYALAHNGLWYRLEHGEHGSLYKTQTKYSDGRNFFFTSPVYQVYDEKGRRRLAVLSYAEAYRFYKDLGGDKKE